MGIFLVGFISGIIVGIFITAIIVAASNSGDISDEEKVKKQYLQQIKYGGMNIVYCPEDMELEKIDENQYIIKRRR